VPSTPSRATLASAIEDFDQSGLKQAEVCCCGQIVLEEAGRSVGAVLDGVAPGHDVCIVQKNLNLGAVQ
jgi:hypothetical protein